MDFPPLHLCVHYSLSIYLYLKTYTRHYERSSILGKANKSMTILGITEWLNLIFAFLALIPATVLIIQYRRTGIQDCLLLLGAFLSSSLTLTFAVIAAATNFLLLYQFHHWSYITLFLFFLFYACRLRWDHPPKVIQYLGVIWVGILALLILFWEVMPQPDRAVVLLWEMPRGYSSYFPNGAGLSVNGLIIFSTAHNIIRIFYSIYVISIALYSCLTVKPFYETKKIILAKRLWIIAAAILLIYFTLVIPWLYVYIQGIGIDIQLLIVISVGLVAYIAIIIPEGLLLSQSQIYRALELYQRIHEVPTEEALLRIGLPSLVEYLKSIPKDLIKTLEDNSI